MTKEEKIYIYIYICRERERERERTRVWARGREEAGQGGGERGVWEGRESWVQGEEGQGRS